MKVKTQQDNHRVEIENENMTKWPLQRCFTFYWKDKDYEKDKTRNIKSEGEKKWKRN
jgi:hypothetical protein